MWLVWHDVAQGVRGVGRRTKISHGCFYKNFESNLTAIIDMHLKRSGIVVITTMYQFRHKDTY